MKKYKNQLFLFERHGAPKIVNNINLPVIMPEHSMGHNIQQPHIRFYDDHATIVNRIKEESERRFIPIVAMRKPIIESPIRLPPRMIIPSPEVLKLRREEAEALARFREEKERRKAMI